MPSEIKAALFAADAPQLTCSVVAVGASAGGLEAVLDLLKHLPPNLNMALVLIQHLDPNHESGLVHILAGSTQMRVMQATEGLEIEAGHLYVIPPNTLMTIKDCKLLLSPRDKDRARHLPIDHFMCSLAEYLGNRSVGVVLSGGGSDGTLGLEAIKSEGGITFAQGDTAKQPKHAPQRRGHGRGRFCIEPGRDGGRTGRAREPYRGRPRRSRGGFQERGGAEEHSCSRP